MGIGRDIRQEVAVPGARLSQFREEPSGGLVDFVIQISPGAVGKDVAVFPPFSRTSFLRHSALGADRDHIAAEHPAIVHHDLRLKFAHALKGNAFFAEPVEPEVVNFAIAGQQFLDLAAAVAAEFLIVFRGFLRRRDRRIIDSENRMFRIAGKVHVVPIHAPVRRRVVKADFQSVFPAGRHIFADEITSAQIVFRIEIAVIARPESETVVMFCRHDAVLDSCGGSGAEPFVRIVAVRREFLRKRPVMVRGDMQSPGRQTVASHIFLRASRRRFDHAP